jgi:hypothetical protein
VIWTGCSSPPVNIAADPKSEALPPGATFFRSALNEQKGAPPEPVLLFGSAANLGPMLAESTTFHAIGVTTLADLHEVSARVRCVGLIAMSLDAEPGGAGAAIQAFRASPSGAEFAVYMPTSLDVQAGASRAAEYAADGMLMRGTEGNELVQGILTILRRVKTGVPRPATGEQHVVLLRELAPKSPFWEMQGMAPEAFRDGMYVDPAKSY